MYLTLLVTEVEGAVNKSATHKLTISTLGYDNPGLILDNDTDVPVKAGPTAENNNIRRQSRASSVAVSNSLMLFIPIFARNS